MNTFKRKSLHAAVLAGLGAVGVAGTANAVHVNPEGLGQALIYPYYTVRADGGGASTLYYDNYMSVVNTTASTKAVKVRFIEARNSREVLDFNLFLSPFDVWTGAVVRTDLGARVVSVDRSCVVPNALFTQAGLSDFRNFDYVDLGDGAGTSLDRTRDGYAEVIEMGVVTNTTATAAAKHNAAGTPANCAYFERNNADVDMRPQLVAPAGGLYGGMSLINVRAGTDFSYDAVALDAWSDTVRYTRAGDTNPDLGFASPPVSNVFTGAGVVTSTWLTGTEAVSAAITQAQVFNEWMLETNTASGTDWVVTFPTKRRYVSVAATAAGAVAGTAANPFNANFFNGRSCDLYELQLYNREEVTRGPQAVEPSPEPAIDTRGRFCAEANVLTFGGSNLLGNPDVISSPVTIDAALGRTGQAIISFNQPRQVRGPLSTTINGLPAGALRYYGLPVVGFAIQDFFNGSVGTPPVMSSYGGSFVHKYRRLIAP